LFFLPSLFERFGLLCDYKPIAAEEGAHPSIHESRSSEMSVTVKRVDGKRHCFFELIVETEDGMTVRVPFNGVELEDLERQIARCFEQ
jgi:hypothetical protein